MYICSEERFQVGIFVLDILTNLKHTQAGSRLGIGYYPLIISLHSPAWDVGSYKIALEIARFQLDGYNNTRVM